MRTTRMLLAGAIAAVVACGEVLTSPDPGTQPGVDAEAPDAPGLVDSPAPDSPSGVDATTCIGDCPEIVATSSREINWVALDATRVLWMDSRPQGGALGDLRSCPKTGCSAAGPAVIFQAHSGSALVSDGNLAFASNAFNPDPGVHRLNADGSTTLVLSQTSISWLSLRENTLYMTTYGTSLERTISNANATTLALGLQNSNCTFPGDGATNTDWSVVTGQKIFLGSHSNGGIFVCPKSGGSFTYFLQGNGNEHYVWSMATNDTTLYWVDSADRLASCPAGDATCSTPTIVLTKPNPSYAGGIRTVLHSNGDLFMETSGGDLIGCKATSCPSSVKPLVHENAFAQTWRVTGSNVAADANHIYYVARDGDPDAGSVTYRLMRLPRKPL